MSGSGVGLGVGGRLTPSASARAELAGRIEAPGAAAAGAPGPSVAKCSRPAREDEEVLRCPRPRNGCRNQPPPAALSSERAEIGRAEEAARELACCAAVRSPALRLCAALGPGTEVRWQSSTEGHRARRQPEQSPSARQPHAGGKEKERVSRSGEGSHQAKAVERALGGSSEPRGRIVRFHQAPRLLPLT